ncbi:branched chain amino acid aminotransferase, partial [archaeon]|nr:branched chain amino acid aminotransferase [archaeon]
MIKKDMDWKNIGFQYRKTNGYVYAKCINGKWGEVQFSTDEYFPIHIAANVLHYGQACFEGMKAFTTKDGKAAIFRPNMSAKRMNRSAQRAVMEKVPEELFLKAVKEVVKKNIDYLPPYGTGSSMYIRPTLIGSGPTIGVTPSEEYTFFVLVTPVGPYYKEGFKPVQSIVIDEYDRAAPLGTGDT